MTKEVQTFAQFEARFVAEHGRAPTSSESWSAAAMVRVKPTGVFLEIAEALEQGAAAMRTTTDHGKGYKEATTDIAETLRARALVPTEGMSCLGGLH